MANGYNPSARIRTTFGHFRVQQGQAELCKDSQSLTEVVANCEVMRNDASCNEVIQSKEVTSLGLEPRTYGLKVRDICETKPLVL